MNKPSADNPGSQPLGLPLNDQLGQASEAPTLAERLRTDVLWHRRRGNETIARDCQDAADEIERLRGIVPEVLERLNDELCVENERLRADATALRELLNNSQTAVCVANRMLVLDGLPGKIAEALARTAYLKA